MKGSVCQTFSWYTERNVNEWERFSALTLIVTLTLIKMYWFTFRSVEHEKSRTVVLCDTIHKLITFVRMTTTWHDTGLGNDTGLSPYKQAQNMSLAKV